MVCKPLVIAKKLKHLNKELKNMSACSSEADIKTGLLQ